MFTDLQMQANKSEFFTEIAETLDRAVNKYDNVFIAGDFNIDVSNKSKDFKNYLCDFIDTFSLTNLVTTKTCYKTICG